TQKWLPVSAKAKGESFLRLPLGSRVHGVSKKGAWSEIDLLNGQNGWVKTEGLGKPETIPSETLRQKILQTAALLSGDPYVWGGLSPFDETHQTWLSGVDCSG